MEVLFYLIIKTPHLYQDDIAAAYLCSKLVMKYSCFIINLTEALIKSTASIATLRELAE